MECAVSAHNLPFCDDLTFFDEIYRRVLHLFLALDSLLRHTWAQTLTELVTFIQQEETQSLPGVGAPGGQSQNVSATQANTGKSNGPGQRQRDQDSDTEPL